MKMMQTVRHCPGITIQDVSMPISVAPIKTLKLYLHIMLPYCCTSVSQCLQSNSVTHFLLEIHPDIVHRHWAQCMEILHRLKYCTWKKDNTTFCEFVKVFHLVTTNRWCSVLCQKTRMNFKNITTSISQWQAKSTKTAKLPQRLREQTHQFKKDISPSLCPRTLLSSSFCLSIPSEWMSMFYLFISGNSAGQIPPPFFLSNLQGRESGHALVLSQPV